MLLRRSGITNAELGPKAHIPNIRTPSHGGHHRHAHAEFILFGSIRLEAFPQLVLNRHITGLIGVQFHHQQAQVIDGAAVIHNQLNTLIAAIHSGPHQETGLSEQMIRKPGVALGKNHRLT